MANPVVYFEIPVSDLNRAMNFYNSVFSLRLSASTYAGIQMSMFPGNPTLPGCSGALVLNPANLPTTDGSVVCFTCDSCASTIERVESARGRTLTPPAPMPSGVGYKAEFADTEGNRVAIYSVNP